MNSGKEKGSKNHRNDILVECLRFVGKKWNPYDTFPEEKRYYSPGEILQFIQKFHSICKNRE